MTTTGKTYGSKSDLRYRKRLDREVDDSATGYPNAGGLASSWDNQEETAGEEIISEITSYLEIRLSRVGRDDHERARVRRYIVLKLFERSGLDNVSQDELLLSDLHDMPASKANNLNLAITTGERREELANHTTDDVYQIEFQSDDDMFKFGEEVLQIDLQANIAFTGGTRVRLGSDFVSDHRFDQVREKFRAASRGAEPEASVDSADYEPIDLLELTNEAENRFEALAKRYP